MGLAIAIISRNGAMQFAGVAGTCSSLQYICAKRSEFSHEKLFSVGVGSYLAAGVDRGCNAKILSA